MYATSTDRCTGYNQIIKKPISSRKKVVSKMSILIDQFWPLSTVKLDMKLDMYQRTYICIDFYGFDG